MSTPETPNLHGVFRFVARLHTLSKRGMRAALANEPKCRYGMLQHLYNLIEQHGYDGAIYVSDIARYMHQPMPAVSRGLRAMEQDGHITRETDPNDRRKTLVRSGRGARPQRKRAGHERLFCPHHGTADPRGTGPGQRCERRTAGRHRGRKRINAANPERRTPA